MPNNTKQLPISTLILLLMNYTDYYLSTVRIILFRYTSQIIVESLIIVCYLIHSFCLFEKVFFLFLMPLQCCDLLRMACK